MMKIFLRSLYLVAFVSSSAWAFNGAAKVSLSPDPFEPELIRIASAKDNYSLVSFLSTILSDPLGYANENCVIGFEKLCSVKNSLFSANSYVNNAYLTYDHDWDFAVIPQNIVWHLAGPGKDLNIKGRKIGSTLFGPQILTKNIKYQSMFSLLANLHQKYIYIIVRKSESINSLKDLRAKRIFLGEFMSDSYITGMSLINHMGMNDLVAIRYLNPHVRYSKGSSYYKDSYARLKEGEVDAILFVDDHKSTEFAMDNLHGSLKVLPINKESFADIDLFMRKHPVYFTSISNHIGNKTLTTRFGLFAKKKIRRHLVSDTLKGFWSGHYLLLKGQSIASFFDIKEAGTFNEGNPSPIALDPIAVEFYSK